MLPRSLVVATAFALCLTASLAHAQQRGKGGERPAGGNRGGGKAPGGEWSQGKPSAGKEGREPGAEGKNRSQAPGAEGAAAGNAAGRKNPQQATGKQGAAAGAAAANRNKPAATGAQGAAAGAAAANRNKPAATGAEGAAAGAAAANRNNPAVSGAAGYAAVRNSFDHPNLYNEAWYEDHRGAWSAANWAAGTAWTATGLAAVASHAGYTNSTPVSYGYGDNVTSQNGNVMVDGQNVGTNEEFSQQAADLAMLGQNAKTADTDKWLPLGVFALVRNEDQQPQTTVQLAINQQGILRGNYTDIVADHALPIEGAVDNKTQRAAWTVGENKNFFMEAGVKNLTDGEARALIHKYGKTELWLLVRLPQPDQDGNASPAPDSSK